VVNWSVSTLDEYERSLAESDATLYV